MKFIHLSPPADFSSELQSQLTVINKNVLYVTHEVDKIKKILTDLKVEQQTLDYYGKKYGENLGSVLEETSPQTDSDEQ